jgi:hypothetical protein
MIDWLETISNEIKELTSRKHPGIGVASRHCFKGLPVNYDVYIQDGRFDQTGAVLSRNNYRC